MLMVMAYICASLLQLIANGWNSTVKMHLLTLYLILMIEFFKKIKNETGQC